MKPRLFIGSSIENLDIANALQQNLEYDANVTIWNQGVFNLSSNAIDDLLKILESTDFGIFIFNPEDITKIRDQEFISVRDNIVFELGLFIGKLGKERVFYLIPRSADDLHLPTDLIGLEPGKYDNFREDGNLLASLGPFSNQVRIKLREFTFENLSDLNNESHEAKKIAIDKKPYWEFLLSSQLLEDKLKPISQSYSELENGLTVLRIKKISGKDFYDFFESALATHEYSLELFNKLLLELSESYGPPGKAGESIEIKNAVDRIIQLCKEQLAWEFELASLEPPQELLKAKKKMQGWSKVYFEQIKIMPEEMRKTIQNVKNGKASGDQTLTLTLVNTADLDGLVTEFREYLINR